MTQLINSVKIERVGSQDRGHAEVEVDSKVVNEVMYCCQVDGDAREWCCWCIIKNSVTLIIMISNANFLPFLLHPFAPPALSVFLIRSTLESLSQFVTQSRFFN